MSLNYTNPGTGQPVATDLVSSVNYQQMKLDGGALGATQPLTGTTVSGLVVDVYQLRGSQLVTPIDALSNPAGALVVAGLTLGWNGTGWDRLQVDGSKYLKVVLPSALPAGSALIGSVGIAGVAAIVGSVAVSGSVDTELPAAAALADQVTNPTAPAVGAFAHTWNGTTWDRLKDATAANTTNFGGSGVLGAAVLCFDTVDAKYYRMNSIASALAGGLDGKHSLSVGPLFYDGSAVYAGRSILAAGHSSLLGIQAVGSIFWDNTTGLYRPPSGQAVGDGVAPPAVPFGGALNYMYDGTSATWNRLVSIRTSADGIGGAAVPANGVSHWYNGNTYDKFRGAALADGNVGAASGLVVFSASMGWNGTGWDRLQVDASQQLKTVVSGAVGITGPVALGRTTAGFTSYDDGTTVSLATDLYGQLRVPQDDLRRLLEEILIVLAEHRPETSSCVRDQMRLTELRVADYGTNPPHAAVGMPINWIANSHGIPFVLSGHPNTVSLRANYTAAQTSTALVTCPIGCKLVVTRVQVGLDKATTPNVSVVIGTASAATPTGAGVIAAHPDLDPGSGFVVGNGGGILGVGNDGEDLFVTCSVPTGGSLDVIVSYFLIPS